jgi:16S rRNA processing protein RimM
LQDRSAAGRDALSIVRSGIPQFCHPAIVVVKWGEMAVVGRIARAHGIHGQVILNVETDFPGERFRPGAEVFIERNGAVEALTLTTVRFHRERPVVGIAGIATMTDAEALAGMELRVPLADLPALPGGTFYRHDLVECRVETRGGGLLGTVERVEGAPEGSRLVVTTTDGEVLIPLVAAICVEIDPAAKRIVVDLPEGLLELNRKKLGD